MYRYRVPAVPETTEICLVAIAAYSTSAQQVLLRLNRVQGRSLCWMDMKAPGPHSKERDRLAALLALEILDTAPEVELDRITRIAARVFNVPVSAVSLVDRDRQWFKSRCGLNVTETSRDISFCGHAILGDGLLVVEDATLDERFSDNPLVLGDLKLRFYAGVPIRLESELPLGTLCVIGRAPYTPTVSQLEILRDLGLLVEDLIISRVSKVKKSKTRAGVDASLTAVLGSMAEAVVFLNAQGQVVSTNPVADELPEFVTDLLTLDTSSGSGPRLFDDAGRRIDGDAMPHRLALGTGQSQPRKVFGIRESGSAETLWFEISADAILTDGKVVGVGCSLLDVTAHQQVVMALRESEQRLFAMAANVPGVIYQFRTYPDGRVEFPYISPGIQRVFGIDDTSWRTNPEWALEAIVQEYKASYAEAFVAAQATLSRFDWEGKTRTGRPGEIIWIHCQSLPMEEPDGCILWSGVVSDTTSSKRQEEALRQSEERFRIVAEQTHQMIYDIDVVTGGTVWEGATWALLGRTNSEMQALSLGGWMDLVHPDDRSIVAAEVERSTARDESFSVRYRFQRVDGAYIWAHDRGTYVRGHRGKPVRMLGTVSDVTAEVNALRQSEESHSRAEALISAIQDTVIRVDDSGAVLDARHLNGWLGLPVAEDTVVSRLGELLSKDFEKRCLRHVRSVVSKRVPERFEAKMDQDGRLVDLEVRLSPSGRNEAVMVLRDISEQRAVERLKSQFVSTVSHELRTPLASVRGALGLMTAGIAGELAPMTKELSELALENTKRLERLINDLLDLESSDSGQLRLDIATCDLCPLLARTLRSVSPFAASYGVGLRFESEMRSAECRVDADRFGQVISNLLSNAIKHSGAETDVVMRLFATSDVYRIEVENSGNPIPESFRPRMFQRFAMADASDSRKRSGTGLGLAIAKALVERMHGRIDYVSGGGVTQFFVELPRLGMRSQAPAM